MSAPASSPRPRRWPSPPRWRPGPWPATGPRKASRTTSSTTCSGRRRSHGSWRSSPGGVAVAVVVTSVAMLGRAVHQGRLGRPWLGTVVPMAAAGVVLGYGGRLTTAGGIGANIGGAMFLFLGMPLVGVLAIAAAVSAWVAWRRCS